MEAIRRAGERRERGTALTVIARELGITADLRRRWTRELGDASPQAVTSRQEFEAENRRLRRANDVLRQERDFARKNGGVLREGTPVSAKYACIAAHADAFAITRMCRVLGVRPTGYHAAQRRPPSARAQTDEAVLVASRTVHRRRRTRYRAPRVHAEVRAEGHRVSRKRVARLMQTDGLAGRRRRRFVRTTDARHGLPVAANIVARQFAPATIGAPDRVWASDITYLPTP
ncbi:MAG: IS3 family transposase [Gemmatimonadaceae bacterium]|nr:IS3 family transposase [Gemmatimonadaceae bacterium]